VGHHSEAFIGIDTSKLRNAVAIAEGGRGGEVRYLGDRYQRGGDTQACYQACEISLSRVMLRIRTLGVSASRSCR